MKIPPHLNGPPGAGHGGFVAGHLSAILEHGHADVWLRAPAPLGVDLAVLRRDDAVVLRDGNTVIAEATVEPLTPDPLPFVGLAAAEQAAAGYPGVQHGPYSTCFGCGWSRTDGLRIGPGPAGRGLVACVWHPKGRRAEEWLWTVLDCGSGWAWPMHEKVLVTGRLHGTVEIAPEDLDPADPMVVVAAPLEHSGRKYTSAASLFTPNGLRVAAVRATWLEVAAPS